MDNQLEERKLKLDEDRLQFENKWKEEDIDVRKLEIKHNNGNLSKIVTPAGALIGALLTVAATVIVAIIAANSNAKLASDQHEMMLQLEKTKQENTFRLEEKKQEATLILSAVQSWHQDVSISNLRFLVDTYLITDPEIRNAITTTAAKIESGETVAPNFGEVPPSSDGERTRINKVDGAVYVYVPPGIYHVRSRGTNVTTDGFWIKQTEVTNREYALCQQQNGCTQVPKNDRWIENPEYALHPVTDITRTLAIDYATWAGGRLPTEDEWEIACGGMQARTYPWGNNSPPEDDSLANWIGTPHAEHRDTRAVGSSPNGRSPFEAFDMAGNVSEMVTSAEEDPAQGTVVRGGHFAHGNGNVTCQFRESPPSQQSKFIGFRVALIR